MTGPADRTIAEIVATRRETRVEPTTTNPFTLGFEFDGPAEPHVVLAALDTVSVTADVRSLWVISRASIWFLDLQYGQWGLRLLAPSAVVERTTAFRRDRPEDAAADDVVVGEFIGDLDLLVVTASGSVLVALPLDPRADWYRVAPSFAWFLDRYDRAGGDKFWE